MSRKHAQEVIETLSRGSFRAECPSCGSAFGLVRAGLFYMDQFTPKARALHERAIDGLREERRDLRELPDQIVEQSDDAAESVNVGCILERLAPALDGFPFHPSECRSLFDPLDYIVFRGLARGNEVEEVALVEIKSGAARLSNRQRAIRDVVESGRVFFDVYDCQEDE